MYVVIGRPCVHHTVCACAYYNSVKIVNLDYSSCSSPKQVPDLDLELKSQRVI